MARTSGKKYPIDLRPAIEHLGLDYVIEQVGLERIIDQVGVKRVIEQLGPKLDEPELDALLAHLTPRQRQALKRRLK